MKEYKLVVLNEEIHLSRKKDIKDAENVLNQYVRDGWILQQIVPYQDLSGALVAVMYKDTYQLN
ncbi:MAG: hypothetical protein IJ958_08490 [Agathobacter sp.]|nr:hypothetical protein [Agathobacter sp.]